MTKRNRATNAEYETRLDALTGLMKRGHSPTQLIRAAGQQWGVSIRQANRYLKAIKEREKENLKQPFEDTAAEFRKSVEKVFSSS